MREWLDSINGSCPGQDENKAIEDMARSVVGTIRLVPICRTAGDLRAAWALAKNGLGAPHPEIV